MVDNQDCVWQYVPGISGRGQRRGNTCHTVQPTYTGKSSAVLQVHGRVSDTAKDTGLQRKVTTTTFYTFWRFTMQSLDRQTVISCGTPPPLPDDAGLQRQRAAGAAVMNTICYTFRNLHNCLTKQTAYSETCINSVKPLLQLKPAVT